MQTIQSSYTKGDEPEIIVHGESISSPINQPEIADENAAKSRNWDLMLCGDSKRQPVRPGCHVSVKLCGSSVFKLPYDLPAGSHYRFVTVNLCGDAILVVPPNTNVSLTQVALCADREDTVKDDVAVTDGPEVKVTIVQLCGRVRVINHGDE
mmetsp:Transcript_13831/g.21075  ORF Transcript_13831/g.21075 Transcript_13831/m.21075 type:complete len:152 (+) Transcript_13831:21-476(+)